MLQKKLKAGKKTTNKGLGFAVLSLHRQILKVHKINLRKRRRQIKPFEGHEVRTRDKLSSIDDVTDSLIANLNLAASQQILIM